MTPLAYRVMMKVREKEAATHEQWVQMHVDATLDEAAKVASVFASNIGAAILALKDQEPCE